MAGFGPISRSGSVSKNLYAEALGIPFEDGGGGYLHTEKMEGVKHFAVWPLSQAAESCFGTKAWPSELAKPQAWIEFDVDDIESASQELQKKGYRLLVSARKEPWGQVVTRLLGPEGLLVGITSTPWMRKGKS